MHPAEIHNRNAKTWTLVRFLKDIGVTAEDAVHMNDDAGTAAARAADVRVPSELTRRLVVGWLAGSRDPSVTDPVRP
jgi:hypothetical protein